MHHRKQVSWRKLGCQSLALHRQGLGLHPRMCTPGRGAHPTTEAKGDVKWWPQLLLPDFC